MTKMLYRPQSDGQLFINLHRKALRLDEKFLGKFALMPVHFILGICGDSEI